MSLNRATTRVAPLLWQHQLRASRARLPSKLPAIAILIPRHALLSTETRTGTGTGTSSAPPPGFDMEKAKRPISADQKSEKDTEASASSKLTADDVAVPQQGATGVPKTDGFQAQTITELAAEKAQKEKEKEKAVAKKEDKKLTVWQKVKKEVAHYWDGTKLLATEVRISSKLALKMAAGYELTRRENRQVWVSKDSQLVLTSC
jgi:LETM1 and EF-hand domain-containing protein 1